MRLREKLRNVAAYTCLALAPLVGGCEGGKEGLEKKIDSWVSYLDKVIPPIDKGSYVYLGIPYTKELYPIQDLKGDYDHDVVYLSTRILDTKGLERKKLMTLKKYLKYISDKAADYYINFYIEPAFDSSRNHESDDVVFTHFIGDFASKDLWRIRSKQNYLLNRKNDFHVGNFDPSFTAREGFKKTDLNNKKYINPFDVTIRTDISDYPIGNNSIIYFGIRKFEKRFIKLNEGYGKDIKNIDLMITNSKNIGIREKFELLKEYLKYISNKGSDYYIGFYENAIINSYRHPKSSKKDYTHFIGDFSKEETEEIRKYQNNVLNRKNDFYIGNLDLSIVSDKDFKEISNLQKLIDQRKINREDNKKSKYVPCFPVTPNEDNSKKKAITPNYQGRKKLKKN